MADSLLITGPPASGKSRAARDRFDAFPDSVFVVPSATMAEHLRNQMARDGAAVRPARITTLAGFLETRSPAPATSFALHFAIEEALARLRPPRFIEVARYRGFREAVAKWMEQAPPDAVPEDLALLFRDVERSLAARGMALWQRRVAAAAENLNALPPHLVFDGFFSLSLQELDLIAKLSERTRITVTLPDWPGTGAARIQLLAAGFREVALNQTFRRASTITFAAPTIEREVEEIARRILDEAARGRTFREIGIVLRAKDPYNALIETALTRFGIPLRSYFADPAIAHPAIAYFAAIVRAMLGGWDHQELLWAMRMPASPLNATPEGDHFDFELRTRLPGAGLPIPDSLAVLDLWRRDKVDPREWAARLKTLRGLLPEPKIDDSTSRERIRAWQSTAVAIAAFDEAMDQVAATLPAGPVRLADFWHHAETALAVESLRIPDRRRNVVHVMDVYEARQWELPVVFVCGLVEGYFPQHHREDPLLRTGRQNEERHLFDLAVTRASQKTILSYARFNEKGEDTIPSFFLDASPPESCGLRVHPRPANPASAAPPKPIEDAALLASLAKSHKALSATSIESFLQCPFQFFARKTLRLRVRPKAPGDRLDLLLQGSIMHRALAEYSRAPLLGSAVFEEVFADECRRARVPATYRTEAVRLEILRYFEAFLAVAQPTTGWAGRVEEEFSFTLNPLLTLRGRIDRLEVGPHNQALVIDYKYSAGIRIRERIEESAAGNLVQGGLYLLAAERQFGLKPAGMLFCGLRKGVVWDGWHVPIAGLEHAGKSVTRADLDEMTRAAASKAMEAFEAISSGRIAVQPADRSKCGWCDYRDICRVKSAGAAEKAGA